MSPNLVIGFSLVTIIFAALLASLATMEILDNPRNFDYPERFRLLAKLGAYVLLFIFAVAVVGVIALLDSTLK